MVVTASATSDPLAEMECAVEGASEVTDTQDPPGTSGQSAAGNIAQPVKAVFLDSPTVSPNSAIPKVGVEGPAADEEPETCVNE